MKKENENNSLLEMATYISLQKQSASGELGITQEYNKENRDRLWDSTKRKAEFKDAAFSGKQTYKDIISGETLHRNQTAAQKKYHMKNTEGVNVSSKWAAHSSETDHVNALKDVHDVAKHNPFLSDGDFKEVMNSDANYRILPKSLNTSKGDKNDWQVILDKNSDISLSGKLHMAKEKVRSDVFLHGKFAEKTAGNIGKEFAAGAMDTVADSVIPLTVEAANQLVLVVQGDKSLEDAAKEVGKDTINTAVRGGTNKLVVDVATAQLANSKSVVLKDIAKNNQVAELIVAAKIVCDSAIRYINNEIDGESFIDEVKENAAMMLAGKVGSEVGGAAGAAAGAALGSTLIPFIGTEVGRQLGTAVGKIVGGMVATMAVGMVCSTINDIKGTYRSIGNQEQAYLDMLDEIYQEATAEMNRQREMLKVEFEKKQIQWTTAIEEGFDTMICGACLDSFDEVTAGLDRVLELFNTEARFHDANEVRNFLNTSDRVFVL